jgi:hypothetical protein
MPPQCEQTTQEGQSQTSSFTVAVTVGAIFLIVPV